METKADRLFLLDRLILLLLLAFTATAFTQENLHHENTLIPDSLAHFLDQYATEALGTVPTPGLVITIVRSDQIVLSRAYGYADLERRIPFTPQTALRAGSVSKPILSTVVLQLLEQGLIDLHTPIGEYIEDIDFDDGYGTASTVAQLLDHSAGYPDKVFLSHASRIEDWRPLREVLRRELPSRVVKPGKVMAYSSWHYALLGYLIEKVTGSPYVQAVHQQLFAPLGMRSSSFHQPLPDSLMTKLARGYGFDKQSKRFHAIPHDWVNISPGIALVTTAEDMGRYMIAMLNGGRLDSARILKAGSMPMVLQRQTAAHPYLRGRSYALSELTLAGRKVMYHDGNGIGFSSRLVLAPSHGLGLFLSTNHRNLTRKLTASEAAKMLRTLSDEILKRLLPPSSLKLSELPALPDAISRTGKFVGHYQPVQMSQDDLFKIEAFTNHVNVRSAADGSLKIGSGYYAEVEPLVFQHQTSPAHFVAFIKNDEGNIAYLTFGGTGSYKKVEWYQTADFHFVLWGLVIFITLSMFLLWPFFRHGHWLGWLISLLIMLYVGGLGYLLGSGIDLLLLFKKMPADLSILFSLPWVIALLLVPLYLIVAKMWANAERPLWSKVHYTTMGISAIILCWLTWYWHLLAR